MRPNISSYDHLNIVAPYPDELLYSVLARFAHHYRIVRAKPFSELVAGQASLVIPTLLPARLDRLGWLIEDRWKEKLESVALRNTLLPFFLHAKFAGVTGIHHVMAMAKADRPSELAKTLGINAARIKMPEVFRYCPLCVELDRAERGETHWRRHHQLPGVFVCADHGVPLSISDLSTKSSRTRAPTAAELIVNPSKDRTVNLPSNAMGRASTIAVAAKAMLSWRQAPTRESGYAIKRKLANAGYTNRNGGIDVLEQDFVAYVGADIIEAIERDWRPGQPLNWLRHLWHKRRRSIHSVRFLLLDEFLKHSASESVLSPFGNGPWVCPNWLAKHYGEPVVTEFTDLKDHRHPSRSIRRFSCECGFVYTRYGIDEPVQKPYRVVSFGPLFTREARRLADDGSSTRRIATELKVDWATADRFLVGGSVRCAKDREKDHQAAEDRDKWRALISANPRAGVKALRKLAGALYARLYRRDREWLLRHSPRIKTKSNSQTRVDWSARDEQLAHAVERLVRKLRTSSPKTRLTRTALSRRLGVQSMVEKNLAKLPLTLRILEATSESWEQYRVRRLREAREEEGESASIWRIVRTAGLRPESVTNSLLQAAGVIQQEGAQL